MNTLQIAGKTIHFASPRRLPSFHNVTGRVIVLDIAFATETAKGGFAGVTLKFITHMGKRLVAWVDHHDHERHADFADDKRFILRKKSEFGACPPLVTPDLVKQVGGYETIVCHSDFDGIYSAAKWLRGGVGSYAEFDADSIAVDTRIGELTPRGKKIDQALRAEITNKTTVVSPAVLKYLYDGCVDLSDEWALICQHADEVAILEERAAALAEKYTVLQGVLAGNTIRAVFVDATALSGQYDKTVLLLLGQKKANIAILKDRDNVSFAAAFDSGINFLQLFDLSGGMPTLVSIHGKSLDFCLERLGIDAESRGKIVV